MRILARLLGLRRSAAVDPAAQRLKAWRDEVRRLTRARDPQQAVSALKRGPAPLGEREARETVEEIAAPLMRLCEQSGAVDAALDAESWVYFNLIRCYEHAAHYNACLQAMDRPLQRMGAASARAQPVPPLQGRCRRILFYLHNMDADLAHIKLLSDLVMAYLEAEPAAVTDIGLIGWTSAAGLCPTVRQLRERGVYVREVPFGRSGTALFDVAASELAGNRFDRLVFLSVPIGLSFAVGRFGPTRLGWLSMKFELHAVSGLVHRYSFTTGLRKRRKVEGVEWLSAAPLMNDPPPLRPSPSGPPEAVRLARSCATVLYTVNRAEKIRDPAYLQAVCGLLERFPGTAFVWTGRRPLPDILEAFESRGLAHRQFFAGWVEPDDLLLHGDIFLDTPHLSGTVAARAMALGKPVVSWAGSHAWINFFGEAIARDIAAGVHPGIGEGVAALKARGIELECVDAADFTAQAALLIKDPGLRTEFGALLALVARHYFLDRARAARDHFANLHGELPQEPR
ncbi:MAG: hypothetical protein HY854_26290 [Burkholderiales bacterium]|nr:hypothetical protein [Burkholderiales bacterium]